MKNLMILLSLIFLISACSNDDDNLTDQELVGKWQLTRFGSGNEAGELQWQDIEEGETLIFYEDLNFESDETRCQNTEMNIGFYRIERNTNEENNSIYENYINITIDNCSNEPDNVLTRSYYYEFENGNLVLIPRDPICTEGCKYIYEKQ